MPSDRTPRNPNEVLLVPMTADALRHLRNAAQSLAYNAERLAAGTPSRRVQETHQATARIQRGLAADLSLIFDGRSGVVGDSLTEQRASEYSADKQQAK